MSDPDSATGKTQSSRTWALASKTSATEAKEAAKNATTTMKNALASVKAAITGSKRVYMWISGKGYPLKSVKDVATGKVYDTTYCRMRSAKPADVTDLWLKPIA